MKVKGTCMIQKPIIYLAGPMSGCTWREATEWRDYTKQELKAYYDCISPCVPMRIQDLDEMIGLQTQEDMTLPIYQTATGVTSQDEWFIDKADWVLANFTNATKVSIGTIWELGYAWGRHKKIISVFNSDNVHNHPFVRRRSHVFVPTLEESIEFFKAINIVDPEHARQKL